MFYRSCVRHTIFEITFEKYETGTSEVTTVWRYRNFDYYYYYYYY